MAARLLIVEDEEMLSGSLKRVLTRKGYDVEIAGSAEQALTLLKDIYFDLIIADIILLGLIGIELIRRIREYSSDQIVIIITAYASLKTAIEALRAGACSAFPENLLESELFGPVRGAFTSAITSKEGLFE